MPANSSESCSHCISLSHTFNYSVVNLPTPLIRSHIKTRTLLQPFVRLYPTVAVGVGTQVTVTAHTGNAEILLHAADEGTHRVFLLLCAGILRMSVLVQTTLVGDADALTVEPQGVGTYLLQRTSAPNVAVLANVEVIADACIPLARWQRSKSFCVKFTFTRVAVNAPQSASPHASYHTGRDAQCPGYPRCHCNDDFQDEFPYVFFFVVVHFVVHNGLCFRGEHTGSPPGLINYTSSSSIPASESSPSSSEAAVRFLSTFA